MGKCVVKKCESRSQKHHKASGISFHRIPKDPVRREKWVEIIRLLRKKTDWLPTIRITICSNHFRNQDKIGPQTDSGIVYLSNEAVPMLVYYRHMAMASTSSNEVCLYCEQPEDKQELPCFQCQYCKKLVHLSCLPGHPPSTLAGDVFFDFTCFFCSPNRTEEFVRSKMTWTYVLILSINNLQQHYQGISNRGFFHYKTHVSWFIDRNWKILFGNDFKQKKNWIGTLVGALSSHSGTVFQSSAAVNGELGWWRLLHKLSPAVTIHIIQEMARDKAKIVKTKKLKGDSEFRLRNIEQIACELGYEHLLYNDAALITNDIGTVPCKKRRVDSDDSNGVLAYQSSDYNIDSDSSYDFGDSRMATVFRQHHTAEDNDSLDCSSAPNTSLGPMQYSSPHYDSDSRSRSPTTNCNTPLIEESELGRATNEKLQDNLDSADVELNMTTLFSKELNSISNFPWLRPIDKADKNLSRLTEYEEIQLLKRVESMIPDVTKPADKAYLRRFRAKLALRRLKRNKHLPLFNLDNTVKYLGGYSTEDPSISGVSKERVLDRFQASYISGVMMDSLPAIYLVGHTDYAPFQSPYSGAILKPFIRRDTESTPLWLSVMEELLQKTNRNNPTYVRPQRAPIDYSYVKPQHIAAVNNLCAQFFWPGVDLTESLQYPEFSCVVTYKKFVIGFAFLVPNVGHNTAYISFVLTRPEWRHSKIATFMLYHLLQTCTGQDVTLHVSPTNPAIFLYQQFGFKVEELIQDFYEKYFEINSKDCKHALFLRLTR